MQDFRSHPALRKSALIAASAGVASRGISYLDHPNTGGLTVMVDQLVPLHVWSVVWIATAGAIFAGVWSRTVARWAMSLGASLWLVWAISYMWAWIVGDSPRGWVTGSVMAVAAVLMWVIAALIEEVPAADEPTVDGSPRGEL